jgi:hypothetical protein
MRVLRIIGLLLVAIVVLLALVALGARFHDGPVGLFPGGPLEAGLLEEDPISDWSFAADEETIEFQLLAQERSRTVWILVHEGAAFIPCNLGFPPAKSWHERAVEDGRAVLRMRGRRYPVILERIEDAELAAALEDVMRAKYSGGPPAGSGYWHFRITSRAP